MLLSPRSFCNKTGLECCSSCFDSIKPSSTKDAGSKPPKNAIANDFAIGHIPSTLFIDGKSEPRQTGLENKHISNIMCAAIACQQPYGLIFAFIGGVHQSVMGQFSFFEMDQNHIERVVNHYRSTGANNHILCVITGHFTPKQKEIAHRQVELDTKQYIDLMTWLIQVSGHDGFVGVTPPEECPHLCILSKKSNEHNTDESVNADVENQYEGAQYTFSSAHDPS